MTSYFGRHFIATHHQPKIVWRQEVLCVEELNDRYRLLMAISKHGHYIHNQEVFDSPDKAIGCAEGIIEGWRSA